LSFLINLPVTATRHDILEFMRSRSLAVQASVSPNGLPQAAAVGFIVTDDFEIVFDTVDTTRKAINLRRHAPCAFVIGGTEDGDERTVQYEGVADEPAGDDLERMKALYYVRFPDGPTRLQWPGLIYVRVRPRWLRFSDFSQSPPAIVELTS
jgi:pyridoxamine 5'-phosphate oxidase-like protein